MPSQLTLLGYGAPLRFPARARSGGVLTRATASSDPNSIYAGAVVRSGDYTLRDRTSIPSEYPVDMGADGILIIHAHGDLTRQLVLAELYSRRLQQWTGPAGQYVNNKPPIGRLTNLLLTQDQPMVPLNLVTLFTEVENDPLTITLVSGDLPPDTGILASVLSGTPHSVGNGTFQVLAHDPAGEFGTAQVNWTVSLPVSAVEAGALMEETRLKTRVNGALVG